jgi:transcriptional regulator with XRE-family HTH domain
LTPELQNMALSSDQEYLIRFGEHLKTVREGKGISQRELALRCRIDHSDISKMERGERNITILTVLELATALEVKAKKLLDFE